MKRVAFKIGLLVALAASGVGWLLAVMSSSPLFYALPTAVVAGAVAYVVALRLLGPRIARVTTVLDDLIDDGNREMGTASREGDEIDRLVRRADKAIHAVRKREAELNREQRFRREYVGDVSHEIKTPIFAIQGFAETLLNGALDDRGVNRGFVEKIFNHANRLNALANDLSEISRLETGELQLSTAPFGMRAMLQEIRESIEIKARQKTIEVRIDLADGDTQLHADRKRICQVLTNLLENAVKYTNPGGWVEVSAARDAPGLIRLSVQDNGIGIEPHDIPRITERFYRAEKSRSRSEGGTGLGLSIVKHILAAHETTLQVESRVSEGSTFSFTLPAATSESPPQRRQP